MLCSRVHTLEKMKFILPLLVAIAVCSAGVIEDLTGGYKEGDRFFYFPGDDDGELHLVDTLEPADEEFLREYLRNPNNNAYWLFTRANPSSAQTLVYDDPVSVRRSNFDSNKVSVFLAHGWNGNGNNHMNRLLIDAFLENDDVNVIVLDWSRLADRSYITSKSGTPAVGWRLGEFITWLTSFGLSYDKVHLVGFSLGGHLVGNAGRATGGRVARITALDPAGPLWNRDNGRIVPSDGQYVEVIHTNTNFLGYTDPCGDADFYPNGGSSMPGCLLNQCSHSRAYEYMASSVRNNHMFANECRTLRQATRNRCTGTPLNPMGNSDITKSRSGIFRINTARNYPY